MKRMQITDRELIAALRRMVPETGSLLCLGCGHERSCSTHGCAVLREAVERLKELTAQAGPLNDPLTLEELRGMDGEPVWVKHYNGEEWVRLELRLALFGYEGSVYTLTFDREHEPERFQDVRKAWKSFLYDAGLQGHGPAPL